MRVLATCELEALKQSHKKVKHIKHTNTSTTQKYLTNGKFTNKMIATLFNLRCRSINEFKDNFHNQYQDFKCFMCNNEIDSQEHALKCHVIKDNLTTEDKAVLANVQYSALFSDTEKQQNITSLYIHIIQIRNEYKPTTGNNSGPSWMI